MDALRPRWLIALVLPLPLACCQVPRPTAAQSGAVFVSADAHCNQERQERFARGDIDSPLSKSVACMNPLYRQGLAGLNYPYMDLIDGWLANRVQLARELDAQHVTNDQAKARFQAISQTLAADVQARVAQEKVNDHVACEAAGIALAIAAIALHGVAITTCP